MSTVTVRLNPQEQKAFTEYAKLLGMPLSTLLKKTLEEKMEDEFDMKSILNYEDDLKSNSVETFDHNKLKEMLGL